MSDHPRRYRYMIVELEVADPSVDGNDAATDAVVARIQQLHDERLGTKLSAVNPDGLTPVAIPPDAEHDREAEANLIEAAEPLLRDIVAERARTVAAHAARATLSGADAVREALELKREIEIRLHVTADYRLHDAICRVCKLVDNYTPDGGDLIREVIKDGVKWIIWAAAVVVGAQIAG